MRFAYPCLTDTDEEGRILVAFPDVPEAGDDGETFAEALGEAGRSLIVALQYRIKQREPIPEPSRAAKGQRSLPALAAAKLALYREMQAQGLDDRNPGGQAGRRERHGNPPSARPRPCFPHPPRRGGASRPGQGTGGGDPRPGGLGWCGTAFVPTG